MFGLPDKYLLLYLCVFLCVYVYVCELFKLRILFLFASSSSSNGRCVPRAVVSATSPASSKADAPGLWGAVPHTASHFR
jgi:hypothetical protein